MQKTHWAWILIGPDLDKLTSSMGKHVGLGVLIGPDLDKLTSSMGKHIGLVILI